MPGGNISKVEITNAKLEDGEPIPDINTDSNPNINTNNIINDSNGKIVPLASGQSSKERNRDEEVQKLLKIWNDFNPRIGYTNYNEIKAIEEMVKRMPLEESIEWVDYAISIQ